MRYKYLIQKKVKTPTHMFDNIDFQGFSFESFGNNQSLDGDLLVSKTVEASNGDQALKSFLKELVPILDCVSILTQTIISPLATGSQFVYKLENNPDNFFYAWVADVKRPVGMLLDKEVFDDIPKLQTMNNDVALSYLRDSIASFSHVQKLAMLLSCTEALAGSGITEGKCECGKTYSYPSTDKDALKKILGDDLYKKIYTDGLRHKLAHGGHVDNQKTADIAGELYLQITLNYLKNTYRLDSLKEITGAPRSFTFEYSESPAQMLTNINPTLRLVESEWDTPKNFAFIQSLPLGY